MPFTIQFEGIQAVNKFFSSAGRKFNRAMAYFVTRQAREMKFNHMVRSVEKYLTVRNRRFVETSLRYDRANLGGKSPHIAATGSIPRPRFSGWAEQEGGRMGGRYRDGGLRRGKIRKHTININARRGVWGRKVSGPARHKPGRRFQQVPVDQTGSQGKNAVIAALRILARQNQKEAFRINKGHPKLKPGLYKFKGRRRKNGYRPLQLLQATETKRPKRQAWMQGAVKNWVSNTNLNHEWGKALRFVFKGWKRRV